MRRCILGLVLAAGVLASVAGCGGSSKNAAPTRGLPAATAATDASASGSDGQKTQSDALLRSSDSTTAAQSFEGTLHATISAGPMNFSEDGTMAFQAPSRFYMTMNLMGQSFSVLADAPDVYVEVPGQGWFSVGDAVINRDAYEQYAKNRGPVDYAGIVKSLEDHKQVADDVIDGKTYQHYSGTFDLAQMLDKIPADVFKQQAQMGLDMLRNAPPATLEAWIDPDTNLPRRMTMNMDMPIAGKDMTMQMTMDYTSWNQPVDIPPAPTNPRPYSDLQGALKP